MENEANFSTRKVEHFPAMSCPVRREKMRPDNNSWEQQLLGVTAAFIPDQSRGYASRENAMAHQRLRYTQTRAGGRFIQIRSDASVEMPGRDLGIGGTTE